MRSSGASSAIAQPAWRNASRRAIRAEAKVDRRIAAALASGETYRARAIMQRSLRGRASKTVAAITANSKLRPDERLTKRDAVARAATLSPWHGTAEPVDVRAKRKRAGGERPYLAFGWENRVLQEQVGHAIRPFLPRDIRCFLQCGAHRAVERSIALIHERDWRWIIEADFSNFYSSISKEEIASLLPVDGRIAHVVITSDHANRRYTYPRFMRGLSTAVHAMTAFRGLPQGASTSSAVADAFIARQLATLPDDFGIVNYGDNFLIGGRTRREALQNFETLVAAFSRSSCSQFDIVRKQLRRCHDGFNFLGFRITIKRNRTTIEPQTYHYDRAIAQFRRSLARADGQTGAIRVWRTVSSRAGSLSLWPQMYSWCFQVIQALAQGDPKRKYMARMTLDRLRTRVLSQLSAPVR